MDDVEFIDPWELTGDWETVEDSGSGYCWRHRDDPGRYEVTLEEVGDGMYEVDFTDWSEVAYQVIGTRSFREVEGAFRYAQDFMEQFDIEARD